MQADTATGDYFTSKSAEYYIIGFALFAIFWGWINAMLVKGINMREHTHVEKVISESSNKELDSAA
jgi:hypothetical protein